MRTRRYHDKVLALQPFRAGNKYATNEVEGRLYVVWSYGHHWPLYIHDRKSGIWYENAESHKRSQSTRRHADVCRPSGAPTTEVATSAAMWAIIHQAAVDHAKVTAIEFEDPPF